MIELSGISSEVFHYTNFNFFANIILSNKFQASPVIGTESEGPISKGYHYYFSTSRTPSNAYTKMLGAFSVILKLDGRKLAQTYKAHAVDYWGPSFREANKGLTEQEDRLLLNKAEIPNAISYIKEVRLYNPETTSLNQAGRDKIFQVLRALKSRNIPVYVYGDEKDLKTNNKKKSSSIMQLMEYLTSPDNKGVQTYPRNSGAGRKSQLFDYVSLIKTPANKRELLPRYAKSLADKYLTGHDYYIKDFRTHFSNSIHSSKTDQTARRDLSFILDFMQKQKLDLDGLVAWLNNKWSSQEISGMKELKLVETAANLPDWYKKLSRQRQRDYLKEHPNSKIAQTVNKQKQLPGLSPAKSTKPAREDKAPAQDVLEKRGSPTKFKGPRSVSDSVSGKPKVERKIVSRLDKLASLAKQAREAGKEAPDYDLCQVSIPGTNLFCNQNKGIPRKDMPQLKGKPSPNSWADTNLQKDAKGEVDAEGAFKEMLKSKKIKTTPKTVDAASLKATQSQLVGAKIAGMFQALKKEPNHPGITAPIYVSKDGYILDGHHRWAAMVALDMADGLKESVQMPVVEVDMEIEDLVKATNDFADKIGIAQKAGKVKEAASAAKYLEGLIQVAADSVKKLRKQDVYRVLDEALESDVKALAEYIILNRADLKDEVEEVLKEEFNIVLSALDGLGSVELAAKRALMRINSGCSSCGGADLFTEDAARARAQAYIDSSKLGNSAEDILKAELGLETAGSDWWDSLSYNEQKKYVDTHKSTKLKPDPSKKGGNKTGSKPKMNSFGLIPPSTGIGSAKITPFKAGNKKAEALLKDKTGFHKLKKAVSLRKGFWSKPSFDEEQEEFQRVSDDIGVPIEHMKKAFDTASYSKLSEEDWAKLGNTDSYETKSFKDVVHLGKTYGKSSLDHLVNSFKEGRVKTPILLKHKGETTLVGGNTRLMMSRALGIKPTVMTVDLDK